MKILLNIFVTVLTVWIAFVSYALVVAVLFAILFKHKHELEKILNIQHL